VIEKNSSALQGFCKLESSQLETLIDKLCVRMRRQRRLTTTFELGLTCLWDVPKTSLRSASTSPTQTKLGGCEGIRFNSFSQSGGCTTVTPTAHKFHLRRLHNINLRSLFLISCALSQCAYSTDLSIFCVKYRFKPIPPAVARLGAEPRATLTLSHDLPSRAELLRSSPPIFFGRASPKACNTKHRSHDSALSRGPGACRRYPC
jgi:hypothetical protein